MTTKTKQKTIVKVGYKEFAKAIKQIAPVVSAGELEKWRNIIRVSREKDNLVLFGTSGLISVIVRVPAVFEGEFKTFGVYKTSILPFANVVRQDLEIEYDLEYNPDNDFHITIKSGELEYKLADELPVDEQIEGYMHECVSPVVKFEDWNKSLEKVMVAVANEPSRPVLNAVFINDGKMIAADGFRLNICPVKYNGELPKRQLIVPLNVLKLFPKQSSVEMAYAENPVGVTATFKFENVSITANLVTGTFPAYQQLIPVDCPYSITIQRKELTNAIKDVREISKREGSWIARLVTDSKKIAFTNISTKARELYSFKTRVKSIGQIKIALNSQYLLDALKYIKSDTVTIQTTAPSSPLAIFDGEYKQVIMPMFVHW